MKRALTLLAPAVLALGLVACGGDDDDDSPATTEASADTVEVTTADTGGEEAESDVSVTDEQTDMMQQVFPSLSEAQIDCLVEQAGDVTQAMDPSQASALAEECDIDAEDLTDVNLDAISIPDSLPQAALDQLTQMFPGLSEEQISCLFDELGGSLDPSQAAQIAETCDIDPADLQPGG